MKKSELKQMIKEILKEELSVRNSLKESTKPYSVKDFTWLSDKYYAEKFKLAALAYLNGEDIDSALTDIKNELLAAGSAPGARKTGIFSTTSSGDYCIVYRVAGWPAHETAETEVFADSIEEAEELFFDYMLDPENYDAGETVLSESDITVLHIYKRPE